MKRTYEMIGPELLLNYCLGKCTVAEKKEIEKALNDSEELRTHLYNLKLSMSIADDIKEIESIDVKAAYLRTQKTIRRERYKKFQVQLMRYAAFLSLPLLIATLVLSYMNFSKSDVDVLYAEVNTPLGTIMRYQLPDQSIVWLNGGTKLRYPTTFNAKERKVDLEGEAYFEVQADPASPFYVTTADGLTVYVYGTQFNVNAYADEPYIETVLETGKVNVISPDGETTFSISPGERLAYDKKTQAYQQSKIDVYEKTAWKDGKMIFRNAPLEDIFKRLSRHFNADIEFHNHSGKEYKYRATFKDETLVQILDYLSKSANMTWKIEEQIQSEDGTLSKKKIIVELH